MLPGTPHKSCEGCPTWAQNTKVCHMQRPNGQPGCLVEFLPDKPGQQLTYEKHLPVDYDSSKYSADWCVVVTCNPGIVFGDYFAVDLMPRRSSQQIHAIRAFGPYTPVYTIDCSGIFHPYYADSGIDFPELYLRGEESQIIVPYDGGLPPQSKPQILKLADHLEPSFERLEKYTYRIFLVSSTGYREAATLAATRRGWWSDKTHITQIWHISGKPGVLRQALSLGKRILELSGERSGYFIPEGAKFSNSNVQPNAVIPLDAIHHISFEDLPIVQQSWKYYSFVILEVVDGVLQLNYYPEEPWGGCTGDKNRPKIKTPVWRP